MNKNIPLIITFWKLLHILNIISAILNLLLFFIKKELFYKVIEKVTSYGFPLFLIIILDILSIIILIGIKKKVKFWYYTSIIFICLIIFSSLIDFAILIKNNQFFDSIWYMIQILIFTEIGYLIFKEREFF